ncbi:MAG: hypothetical protein EXR35_08540 [Limnohabitans sp.]|nr:hypothetical protein [Limnohabitans sp.]
MIINTVSTTLSILESFLDWYKSKAVFYLTSLIEAPPTDGNWIEMQAKIDGWILEGKKVLLVAH